MAFIFSMASLCVLVPFSAFCKTENNRFKLSISFFVVSWNSPIASVASSSVPEKRVNALTRAPTRPITHPIGFDIMEAHNVFIASVAFVVIAVSIEVVVAFVAFATVSAVVATVDCLTAAASRAFFFVWKSV